MGSIPSLCIIMQKMEFSGHPPQEGKPIFCCSHMIHLFFSFAQKSKLGKEKLISPMFFIKFLVLFCLPVFRCLLFDYDASQHFIKFSDSLLPSISTPEWREKSILAKRRPLNLDSSALPFRTRPSFPRDHCLLP